MGISVLQSAAGSAGGSSTVAAVFTVSAGSAVIVGIGTNNNGATSVTNVTDNQGNTYTLIKDSGHTIDSGVSWSQLWWTPSVSAGSLTVTAHFNVGGGPGNSEIIIAEVTGLKSSGQPDGTPQTTEARTGSGAFPTISLTALATDALFSMVNSGGNSGMSKPSGWAGLIPFTSGYGLAWLLGPSAGSNTVQWGGTFNGSNVDFSVVGAAMLGLPTPKGLQIIIMS